MAESDWQDHKLEIARLYLEEDKPLKTVTQIMLETYGFYKTYARPFAVPLSYCRSLIFICRENQYNGQLTRWGFKKYRMGPKRLAVMKRKMDIRGGEDFEVYVDRIPHCPKRLRREASRQVYTRVIETFASGN